MAKRNEDDPRVMILKIYVDGEGECVFLLPAGCSLKNAVKGKLPRIEIARIEKENRWSLSLIDFPARVALSHCLASMRERAYLSWKSAIAEAFELLSTEITRRKEGGQNLHFGYYPWLGQKIKKGSKTEEAVMKGVDDNSWIDELISVACLEAMIKGIWNEEVLSKLEERIRRYMRCPSNFLFFPGCK